MIPALQRVAEFFEADDWSYTATEDPAMLRAPCAGDNGEFLCHVVAPGEPDVLLVYSACPFDVPPQRRQAMAELLVRASWGLLLGTFEMDFRDGEVRYRTGLALGGREPTSEDIRTVVYENVLAMDRYLPAIEAVTWHDLDPEQAIARVEGTAAGALGSTEGTES